MVDDEHSWATNWSDAVEHALREKSDVMYWKMYPDGKKLARATYVDAVCCLGYDGARKLGILDEYLRIALKVAS